MNDAKAKRGASLLAHHALTVLVFILIAGVLSIPIWIFGFHFAVDTVHTAQSGLVMETGDLQLKEDFAPAPETFGVVAKPQVVGGEHFAQLRAEQIDLDCGVYYGANRICLRAGAAASTSYSLPGFEGTTILTGYNTTAFRNIDQLKKGDMLTLSTKWGQYTYRVTETAVKASEDVINTAVVDREKLILFCSYPKAPFGNLQDKRFYVFCEKASGPAVEVNADAK